MTGAARIYFRFRAVGPAPFVMDDDIFALCAALGGEPDSEEPEPSLGELLTPPSPPPEGGVAGLMARMQRLLAKQEEVSTTFAEEDAATAGGSPAEVALDEVDAPKRRRPGRPSKKPAVADLERHGVADAPLSPINTLELVYDKPQTFKELFTYFSNIDAAEVHLRTLPGALVFYALGSDGVLKVRAEVDCASLNHYFCEGERWLFFSHSHIKKVVKKIDNSFHTVKLVRARTDPINMSLVLVDRLLQRENRFPIPIQETHARPEWECLDELTSQQASYPVSWEIDNKSLKKTHEIAGLHGKVVSIELVGGSEQLKLKYGGSGIAPFTETYGDPCKIGLHTQLPPGGILKCEYTVASGHQYAKNAPGELTRIFCAADWPLLLLALSDVISFVTTIDLLPKK